MKFSSMSLIIIFLVNIDRAYGGENLTSLIPLNVDSVATTRLNDRLVRTILYTTDKSEQLDIELIKTPEMTNLLAKKIIKSVRVSIAGNPRELIFSDSAAVSIDNIRVENGFVKFNIEYFVRTHGGYYLSACEVDANKNALPDPVCKITKQGL